MFLNEPGSGSVYARIDKIKEPRDESGAKRRERGRGSTERDALRLRRVTRGLAAALIGSLRIQRGFHSD